MQEKLILVRVLEAVEKVINMGTPIMIEEQTIDNKVEENEKPMIKVAIIEPKKAYKIRDGETYALYGTLGGIVVSNNGFFKGEKAENIHEVGTGGWIVKRGVVFTTETDIPTGYEKGTYEIIESEKQ